MKIGRPLAAICLVLTTFSAPSTACAANSEQLRKFVEQCETVRKGVVLQLEHELRGLNSGRVKPAAGRPKKLIEEDLAALKNRRRIVAPTLRYPLEAGGIGRLPGATAHVQKVLGPNKFAGDSTFTAVVVKVRHYRAVGERVHSRVDLIIEGVDTGEFTAGADISLVDTFEVVERVRASSAQAPSCYLLRKFDMQAVEPQLLSADR